MTESLSLKKCRDKLLDLGKKNRLLYFSYGASALRILSPEKEWLFDAIKGGKKVPFFDLDSYLENIGKPFHFLLDDECTEDDLQAAIASSRGDRIFLQPTSARKKLSQVLRIIKNTADDAFANRGIQTLYLAFGLLKWKDAQESNLEVLSPLVLIPVYMIKNENGQYSIYADEGAEPSVNGTLQYQLKGQYGFVLPALKEDSNLSDYLALVKSKAETMGWDVIDECNLGLYTFAKIDMYSDLLNNESSVLRNEYVAKLFDAGANDEQECLPDVADEEKAEESLRNGTAKLHNVVDADSSQLKAILAAKKGRSFVLQGPPGTGKSQTITNIIAEALHDGKNVLFVSEKMAALEVVYNKLSSVGLGDFCLRLHGHKANKKSVVEDIDHSMNLPNVRLKEEAVEALNSLEKETEMLNSYESALHDVIPEFGVSPFQLYAEMDRLDDIDVPLFSFEHIENCGKEFLDDAVANFETIREGINIMGNHYADYCLYGYRGEDSYEGEIAFASALSEAKVDLDALKETLEPLNDDLNVSDGFASKDMAHLFAFLKFFKTSSFFEPSLFDKHRDAIATVVKEAIDTEDRIKALHDSVITCFTEDIFTDVKTEAIAERYEKKYGNIFRGLMPQHHRDRKHLRTFARDDALPFKKTRAALHDYAEHQKATRRLEELRNELSDSFDNKRNCSDKKFLDFLSKVRGYLPFIDLNLEHLAALREKDWAEIKKKIDAKNLDESRLEKPLSVQSFYEEEKRNLSSLSFNELRKLIYEADDAKSQLHTNSRFVAAMKKTHDDGYGSFVEECLSHDLPIDQLVDAFKKVLTKQRIYYAESKRSILSELTRQRHDELIEKFQGHDKMRFAIAQAEVKKAVLSRFPASKARGVYGKLSFEVSKKRNIKPVRALMDSYQGQIQTFKPCFMMSPLSVSTFLKPDYRFDLVVFDEASQVYPWDAIGAIYRANQVIVVGDNKQMPPTNFFVSMDALEDDYNADEDDVNDVGDFESILDFFMNFPHYRLLWHYRSKNEALIAFSNHHFYDDSLITFPSSQKAVPGFGVDFVYAKGTYNRGSRFNPIEAKKVANVVYENVMKHPERSIGVVSFNVRQQEEIENCIEDLCDAHPSFRKALSEKVDEPLFVKNLETVQGDERDVIVLSVGYGKDKSGNVGHNFGPLNRAGGERRLNVAITRAKINTIVVSSIRYSDLDISKCKSEGSKLLRSYLNYAENGVTEDSVPSGNGLCFESPFEEEVYNFLDKNGYKVDTQVGCSSYRIDLGVKHPKKPAYVLAVECDGASYHSSRVARDRDRLRQEVLESQGWNFHRVWSTDWFRDRKNEEMRLLDAVRNAMARFNAKDADDPLPEVKEEEVKKEAIADVEEVAPKRLIDYLNQFVPFVPVVQSPLPLQNVGVAARQFGVQIIEKEGPITLHRLCYLLIQFCGRTKVTKDVKERVEEAMILLKPRGVYQYGDCYALKDPKDVMLRFGGGRDFGDIPQVEYRNAMLKSLEIDPGQNEDALYRSISEAIGYNRAVKQLRLILSECLGALKEAGLVYEDEGCYYLK